MNDLTDTYSKDTTDDIHTLTWGQILLDLEYPSISTEASGLLVFQQLQGSQSFETFTEGEQTGLEFSYTPSNEITTSTPFHDASQDDSSKSPKEQQSVILDCPKIHASAFGPRITKPQNIDDDSHAISDCADTVFVADLSYKTPDLTGSGKAKPPAILPGDSEEVADLHCELCERLGIILWCSGQYELRSTCQCIQSDLNLSTLRNRFIQGI